MSALFQYQGVYYDDVYFAECADSVLESVDECDDETLQLAIICMAYCVEATLSRN